MTDIEPRLENVERKAEQNAADLRAIYGLLHDQRLTQLKQGIELSEIKDDVREVKDDIGEVKNLVGRILNRLPENP